eukprot:5345806-Pyramimonas_sp.AAC.1
MQWAQGIPLYGAPSHYWYAGRIPFRCPNSYASTLVQVPYQFYCVLRQTHRFHYCVQPVVVHAPKGVCKVYIQHMYVASGRHRVLHCLAKPVYVVSCRPPPPKALLRVAQDLVFLDEVREDPCDCGRPQFIIHRSLQAYGSVIFDVELVILLV